VGVDRLLSGLQAVHEVCRNTFSRLFRLALDQGLHDGAVLG
jgi:hypothetical protein